MEVSQVFTQVAYDQEDYYHSVQWLEESVRLFRGTGSMWSPENEGTLHDALDHLAFSHFKVGKGNCTDVKELSLKNAFLISDRKRLACSQSFSGVTALR